MFEMPPAVNTAELCHVSRLRLGNGGKAEFSVRLSRFHTRP
jgi:hypothetical protein